MNYYKKPYIFCFFLFIFVFNKSIKAEIAFSFDNVNLVSVINVLSNDLNKNFIIDENLDTKISLIIKHPINEIKVFSLLQKSLLIKNIVLLDQGNNNILVTKREKVTTNAPLSQKNLLGQQLYIIKLKFIAPNKMIPFLKQFFPDTTFIEPTPDGQNISFIGDYNNYTRMIGLIKKFDTKKNKSILKIKLKNTKANEIKTILNTLINSGNWLIGPNSEISSVALEKANTLIISGNQNSLDQIEKFILDMDSIKIDNNLIESNLPKKITNESKSTTKIINKNEKIEFEVLNLKNGNAEEITNTLKDLIFGNNSNDNSSLAKRDIMIKPYMPGNQVILYGNEASRKGIKSIIEKIDIPNKQVFVEAVVAELSTSSAKELGIQFSGSSGSTGLTILNNNSLAANISSGINSFISDGIGLTIGPGAKTLSNLGALINFIENDGNSEILATPTLLAMNNRQAQILVGSNIPIITGKFTSDGSEASSPFQTISRQDVGIIFKIKPIIGSDGFLTIEMAQEVSELDTTSALASDIVTTKRAIQTSASVKSGNTIAIGGLINESTQFLGSKIPILGDLPGIKELFNEKKSIISRRNLVIFLKPTIIENNSTISEITYEKFITLKNEIDVSRYNNTLRDDYPPLPLINEFNLK